MRKKFLPVEMRIRQVNSTSYSRNLKEKTASSVDKKCLTTGGGFMKNVINAKIRQ